MSQLNPVEVFVQRRVWLSWIWRETRAWLWRWKMWGRWMPKARYPNLCSMGISGTNKVNQEKIGFWLDQPQHGHKLVNGWLMGSCRPCKWRNSWSYQIVVAYLRLVMKDNKIAKRYGHIVGMGTWINLKAVLWPVSKPTPKLGSHKFEAHIMF